MCVSPFQCNLFFNEAVLSCTTAGLQQNGLVLADTELQVYRSVSWNHRSSCSCRTQQAARQAGKTIHIFPDEQSHHKFGISDKHCVLQALYLTELFHGHVGLEDQCDWRGHPPGRQPQNCEEAQTDRLTLQDPSPHRLCGRYVQFAA